MAYIRKLDTSKRQRDKKRRQQKRYESYEQDCHDKEMKWLRAKPYALEYQERIQEKMKGGTE